MAKLTSGTHQQNTRKYTLCAYFSGVILFGVPMMTSSNEDIFRVTCLCAGKSPVTDEFPAQKQVTRSFDVFFVLRLNKRLIVIVIHNILTHFIIFGMFPCINILTRKYVAAKI